MNNEQLILTIMSLPRIGRKSVHKLLQIPEFSQISSLKEILIIMNQFFSKEVFTLEDIQLAREKAEEILLKCVKYEIEVLSFLNPLFPARLKLIPDPPILLYAKGNLKCLNEGLPIAVIGTREPTEYGVKMGKSISSLLASSGITIVSGLATGCDAVAHLGCLEGKGTTVAILAHGLDTIYPKENRSLANQILEENGCWLSEYPPGVRGMRNFFVERDRLQSGLSIGVIVVETDIKGGTMYTVGFCLDENKPLGCLNHPDHLLNEPKTRGNQKLIFEGKGIPITNFDSLEEFVNLCNRRKNHNQKDKTILKDSVKPQENEPNQISLWEDF
ncbi:DNA-processing protein DprA [Brevibacillus fortis]|uniref:DNA-processing protein DprA n=1 Tax=Brevibacillus fortis TaxID=2126352 RepID=A0A2P7VH34_9BACL|nr:DNA-processing protein DprA [Brevibacillus fortis]PSJ98532.1 DNA-processing protein DprA [Brevibacillus fortis]